MGPEPIDTDLPDIDDLTRRFAESGFLCLPGLIGRDTAEAMATLVYGELDGWKRRWMTKTGVDWEDPAAITAFLEPILSGPDGLQVLDGDLQHLARGELPLPTRLRPELKAVAHVEPLTRVLQALLGEAGLRMHNPPSIRASVPNLSFGNVPPHQDWAYNRHVARFVTVWIPLCEINDDCGGVDLYHGSHSVGPVPHGPHGPIWKNTVDPDLDLSAYPHRHLPMSPGDALLFCPELLHASHPNRSDRVRCSIDYRFFAASTPTSKHCYDPTSRTVIPPPGDQR